MAWKIYCVYHLNFLDKVLDLISSNSGNTFQKTINLTFTLYTSSRNDTVLINYGNSFVGTLKLYSSKIITF